MRLRLLALLLALVSAAGVARVVTYEPDPPTAAEVYAAAVKARTARVTIAATIGIPDTDALLRATATGVADLARDVASVRVTFDEATNPFELPGYEAVSTNDRMYLRAPGGWVSYATTADPARRGATDTPWLVLRFVRDTGDTWAHVGDERLDGRRVRHFRGRMPYLNGTLDAWVGRDGRPVRVEAVLDNVGAIKSSYRLDVAGYGTEPGVEVPGGARPVADVDEAYEAVGL